jgi:hypothetical protein
MPSASFTTAGGAAAVAPTVGVTRGAGWPTRHAVPNAELAAAIERTLAGALSFACGCRRPVGDVALCAHASVHHRLRRWTLAYQRHLAEEQAAWQAMCTAARDAAVAQHQREDARRVAAGPPGPPLQFRSGAGAAGGGGAHSSTWRRRSSAANLSGALASSGSLGVSAAAHHGDGGSTPSMGGGAIQFPPSSRASDRRSSSGALNSRGSVVAPAASVSAGLSPTTIRDYDDEHASSEAVAAGFEPSPSSGGVDEIAWHVA